MIPEGPSNNLVFGASSCTFILTCSFKLDACNDVISVLNDFYLHFVAMFLAPFLFPIILGVLLHYYSTI